MTALRDRLERPYRAEHDRSTREKAERALSRPRTLRGLLRWARLAWAHEMPVRLHAAGVWRDYGEHAMGASALGAPRYADPFRRLLENRADEAHYGVLAGHETTGDGQAYDRPMRAALRRIHGPTWQPPFTTAAHRLFALVCLDFDLATTGSRMIATNDGCLRIPPLHPFDAEGWWSWALSLWWDRTTDGPL